MKQAALLTLFLLASCATTKSAPPAIEVRTVMVDRIVPTPCIAAEPLRALIAREPAKIAGQLNGDAVHDLDLVAASALRLRAYVGELQAALGACAK